MLELAPPPRVESPPDPLAVALPPSAVTVLAPPARPRGQWRRRLDTPRVRRARMPWIVALSLHAVVLGGGLLYLPSSPLRIGEGTEGSLVLHESIEAAVPPTPEDQPLPREEVEPLPDLPPDPSELSDLDVFESTPLPEATEPEELLDATVPAEEAEPAFPSIEGLLRARAEVRPPAPPPSPTPAPPPVAVAAPVRPAPAAPPPAVATGRAQLRPRFKPVPPYPEALRQAGVEGVVTLRIVVEADGTVSDARVVASSGFPDFDAAAVATIRRWQFDPPGERRAVDAVPVRFRLR